jgi:hypothetical protein
LCASHLLLSLVLPSCGGRADVNLHYQFIGSYTSTGSGSLGGFYCNKLAIEAARKHDMGVFIISPTDKGGHLYMPPKKMADACGARRAPFLLRCSYRRRRRRRRRRRGCRLQTVASGCLYPELCVAGSERHSSRCDIAHMD